MCVRASERARTERASEAALKIVQFFLRRSRAGKRVGRTDGAAFAEVKRATNPNQAINTVTENKEKDYIVCQNHHNYTLVPQERDFKI